GAVGADPAFVVDVHDHAAQRLDRVLLGALLAQPVHVTLETAQALGVAAVQHLAQADLVAGGVQGDAAGRGVVAQLLQGGGADLAARHVDHPQVGVVVVRVDQQAEVAHQVLHFLAGEEAGATGQAIGNLVVLQLQLHQLGLVVAAVEDGEVAVRALGAQVFGEDFQGHALALGLLVARTDHTDLVAVAHLRPELFLEYVRVVGNQHVGALEDAAGGAVVLLQHHHFQRGVILFQAHQIFRARATPGVDRLVVVADYGELAAHAYQLFYQQVLAGVGVLVFVDQQVADAVLPFFQDVGVFLVQPDRQQYQVVDVHRVVRLERALVMQVDDGGGLFLRPAGVGQGLVWQDQVVLPAVDVVPDLVGAVIAGVLLLHDVGQQGLDVTVVEDREARRVAQRRIFPADDVHAQIVEGGHRQAACLGALEQAADTLLHFPRGLVGNGHGVDVAGLDSALLHQVGDFACDHAGLAGAGAGQ